MRVKDWSIVDLNKTWETPGFPSSVSVSQDTQPSMPIPCLKPFLAMRVKDWSIVDLNETEGTPGSPQCASVTGHPTLNANTLLKAISGHESERLEYRWLERDRGDTRLPPVCQCHRTPNPQCQHPAKGHFWPWEWKTGVSLTWTRQRGHQAPPSVPVSQDTQPSMPTPC